MWISSPWKREILISRIMNTIPDSKVHGANMGPTWDLSAPGGSHVGPMNLAIWDGYLHPRNARRHTTVAMVLNIWVSTPVKSIHIMMFQYCIRTESMLAGTTLKLHWCLQHHFWFDVACLKSTHSLIARFIGPTWGSSGADRTQVGPMLAPWTLLCGFSQALSKVHYCGSCLTHDLADLVIADFFHWQNGITQWYLLTIILARDGSAHYNDTTWTSWHLKSPMTWLSVQQLLLARNEDSWRKQSSALLVLCEGNPPVTGGLPSQRRASNEGPR